MGDSETAGKTLERLLGVKESYQLPDALMSALLDNERRESLLGEIASSIEGDETDPLRDYFQEHHSNREAMMQDYTPDCVCELVARIAPGSERTLDMCSGTGALTLFATDRGGFVQCEELSTRAIPVLLLNLALRNKRGIVVNRDVVTDEAAAAYRLESGVRFSSIEPCDPPDSGTFGTIVSNPPYSLKWDGARDLRLLGWDTPPKSKADYLLVIDALNRLEDGGTAVFILPHGVLFRGASEGRIRAQIIEGGWLHAVIGLPDNLFMNTGIPVCLVVLKKGRENDGTLFIDASRLFEKCGKVNVISDNHISRIVEAYEKRRDMDKLAHLAGIDEMRENDYNLNIPRYVDTFEYVPPPSLMDCVRDLVDIDRDIVKAEREIAASLAQLTGNAHGVDYRKDMDEFIRYLNGAKA